MKRLREERQKQPPASVQFYKKALWLNGSITNQEEADDVIAVVKALQSFLPTPPERKEDERRTPS